MVKRIKKECQTHTVIHLRDSAGEIIHPRYCVEVACLTHESSWAALADEMQHASDIAHSFPLVFGGLKHGKDAMRIPDECILSKIPEKQELPPPTSICKCPCHEIETDSCDMCSCKKWEKV